jgi:hypothetical protein
LDNPHQLLEYVHFDLFVVWINCIFQLMNAAPTKHVLDYDPLEIARQLTLLDYETYAAIEPTELLNQAWCKQNLMHRFMSFL